MLYISRAFADSAMKISLRIVEREREREREREEVAVAVAVL